MATMMRVAMVPSFSCQCNSQSNGIYSPVQFLAIMKTVPLNILVLVQVYMFKHFSLGRYLEMELLGYGVHACST